ncbi:hypothetical protein FJZ27_01295 [Candidatus Peribacteria bacterium]|nr:hypothetical protein [Candidatus Peribacteria bacterium]
MALMETAPSPPLLQYMAQDGALRSESQNDDAAAVPAAFTEELKVDHWAAVTGAVGLGKHFDSLSTLDVESEVFWQ